MTEVSKGGSEYVGYEYKRKEILREHASLYLDSYPCFGWEEDPNAETVQERIHPGGYVNLNFRRDRKICNKVELTRLQRNFDGCILEIDRLEKSKTTFATIAAIVIGVVGTATHGELCICSNRRASVYYAVYPPCHSGVCRLDCTLVCVPGACQKKVGQDTAFDRR